MILFHNKIQNGWVYIARGHILHFFGSTHSIQQKHEEHGFIRFGAVSGNEQA
jgi:hypothetical protein